MHKGDLGLLTQFLLSIKLQLIVNIAYVLYSLRFTYIFKAFVIVLSRERFACVGNLAFKTGV